MAHQLDDRSFVTRLDPKEMLRLTEEFPKQCREALAIAQSVEMPALDNRPSLAMLTGMGGSAAGGDFAKALFEAHGSVPFFVNRDYHLPNFVGLGDVVFCASYSGNTEETLSAYDDAKSAGSKIICVTSGGKLAEKANADGNTVIIVPGGQPPRTALGYMLIPVLVAAEKLKLIPAQNYEAAFKMIDEVVTSWSVDAPFDQNEGKQIAEAMHGGVAVIYGLGSWQGIVANRWKGQMNENAKNLAFPNSFPELNHNEILGWMKAGEQGVAKWVGIILESGEESEKMKARADVTEQLVGKTAKFFRVRAKGSDLLQKLLTLTFYGDFVSIYLAALNGIDPENIDAINTLKSELAKIG